MLMHSYSEKTDFDYAYSIDVTGKSILYYFYVSVFPLRSLCGII